MNKEQADQDTQLFSHVERALWRQLAMPLPAGLYLVATPIGNLADITLRALAVLAGADLIYCEDTRHSSRLLSAYGIEGELRSYHEHNAHQERTRLLDQVRAGKSVALISDAGMPLISDPGFKLVRSARAEELEVTVLPGASAPVTALVSAGLATDMFLFAGFLPPKQQARQKRLLQMSGTEATLLFFESPKRLKASLRDMVDCFGTRPGAVARELTKLHETVKTGTIEELAEYYATQSSIKGEIVLLVGGAQKNENAPQDSDLSRELQELMASLSLRDAVQAICIKYDLPRSRVYGLAIEVKKSR